MIKIIGGIVNWFSNNFRAVAVGFIGLLIATVFVQNRQLRNKDKEIDRVTNNIEAYKQLALDKGEQNRVLQLTIDELNSSNDSLISEIKHAQKNLKIKNKNLTNISVINTEVKDSVKTIIKHKMVDFKQELKLNSLTTIIVSRQDSILKAVLDIQNQQILFVEEKKEYRKNYKSGFVRFLHLDWRRKKVKKYQITNSNPIIKVTDTRVIEVSK